MIKHEIKIEFTHTERLVKIIEKSYFEEGLMGKIRGKNNFLEITKEDEIDFLTFKDLDGVTVKVFNRDIIDGVIRFMITQETDNVIKLYPISIYCIKEGDKYIFY